MPDMPTARIALKVSKPAKFKRPGHRGKPPFVPTDDHRKIVESGIACGIPQHIIAKQIGIDPATLRDHFREEIDTARDMANGQVVNNLFGLTKTHPVAAFFWLVNRDPANWQSINKLEVNTTIRNEMPDLSHCSADELALLRQAAAIVTKAQARQQIEGHAKDVTPAADEDA